MGEAALESALDVLAQLIAHGQAIVAQESVTPDVVDPTIDDWRTRVERWVQVRRDLEPGDGAAIRAVLETDAPFLRSVRDAIDE